MLTHPDPDRWVLEVVASALPWQPVIDGDTVPGPPIERIAAGASGHVDVIAGTNTDDWKLFLVASGAIGQITERTLTAPIEVEGYRALAAYGLPTQTALHAYRAAYPDAGPGDLLARVQTDWWTRIASRRSDNSIAVGASCDRDEERRRHG
jgi:para-nitrobenzyl esterase